jgi:dipeptidyl aminopeptidase/acylaminoacyl peptidase
MANRWGTTAEEPFSLLPNFGISVLVMTFPGREGFGPEFYNALKEGRNFGQLDIDEAAQVVEHLIALGYTARDRVGITGCSYGGYFAVQSIIRHPDLYAAAVAQCTLLDLEHAYEFTGRSSVAYWEGRVPDADAAEYIADSPVHHAAEVRTPLLLVHGTEDQLPVSMVEDFRDQIVAHGTPVELITFKGEGHGLSNPSSHMAAAQAQIRWFQKYLAGGTVR